MSSPSAAPLLLWLTPALLALLLYGLGQGFVKMWITQVPPARFCLYFACARAAVMGCYFLASPRTPVFAAEGHYVLAIGVLAYLLDGAGWIMYFHSIIAGPITIVGTLSAAYPAVTIVFAHWFLGETLSPLQYGAVALVIGGCIGLAYQPADAANKVTGRAWIVLAFTALMLWGGAQTMVKYDYNFGATDANMALYSAIGALLTLGIYGVWKGGAGTHSVREWTRSFLPMGMMAAGDLGVLIASRYGEISIVTPLTGAYPLVTLAFAALVLRERITLLQWGCIAYQPAGCESPGRYAACRYSTVESRGRRHGEGLRLRSSADRQDRSQRHFSACWRAHEGGRHTLVVSSAKQRQSARPSGGTHVRRQSHRRRLAASCRGANAR